MINNFSLLHFIFMSRCVVTLVKEGCWFNHISLHATCSNVLEHDTEC